MIKYNLRYYYDFEMSLCKVNLNIFISIHFIILYIVQFIKNKIDIID